MGAYCKHVIDIDRKFWRRDIPGDTYQVIIQVDSEMTLIHGTCAHLLKATDIRTLILSSCNSAKYISKIVMHSIITL